MTEPECSVLLVNPKYPHNVGNALRACALLGASKLHWTGRRVPYPDAWPEGARLPREERLRAYARTRLSWSVEAEVDASASLSVPVCVEISDTAEDLRAFQHPIRALYVFGPEDGSVPKAVRMHCHRFVRIPTAFPQERTPYNLAAAVNIVLFHRLLRSVGDELIS